MRSKNVVYTLIIIILMLALALVKISHEPKRKEMFNRAPEHIEYTNQARCQMNCYAINEEEIAQIMKHGIIILNDSNPRSRPCATFSLEMRLQPKKYLRVLFAQCDGKTLVITAFKIGQQKECDCHTTHN